jgi:putative Ig domain-containing protein
MHHRKFIFAVCGVCLAGCGGGNTQPPPIVATQLLVRPVASTTSTGTAVQFTVTAADGSATVAPNYAGTVHFTSSDGKATLPVDSKLSNGAGSFSVTFKTAGAQNLSATDTVTASLKGASSINVNPGPATQLSVTATSAATAMLPFNVALNVVDAYGNVATNYTGTVHFTSSDTQAALPADSTLANGTGSFSATLKTIGSQTITATDTSAASLKATSSSINVVSNAATHLSVSGSGSANTRAGYNFKVSALDAANNVSAAYSGTVHFTSSDVQAVLPANLALTTGSSSSLSAIFETAGTQTLSAADASKAALNGKSSISVSVTPAPTISSTAPPEGAVSVTYGPSSLREYKCIHDIVWSCVPCGGAVSCHSLPVCYQTSPCLLLKTVFAGFPFMATGGVPPFSWSATGVPPGLTMSSTGYLSGKPTSPGTYPITVTATDS